MKKFLLLFFISIFPLLAQLSRGPVAGAVTVNSAEVIFKTFLPQNVIIEYGIDNNFNDKTGPVQTDSSHGLYAKLKLTNLKPDTRYYYRAVINGITSSVVKSFQTFPENDNYSFSFGFGSCQQSGYAPWNPEIFPAIGKDSLRFFIQLGDWTYPDSTEKKYGYRFNSKEQLLIKSYDSKYDNNYPFVSEVLSKLPVVYLYDDHDFAADDPDGTDVNKQKSIDAYKNYFPHYPLQNENNGIWQKFTFSNVDFFVLDLRSQRSSQKNVIGSDGTVHFIKGNSLLAGYEIEGINQKEWLLEELKNSKAAWKVIVSSVIFNPAFAKVMGNIQIKEKYPWLINFMIDKWAGYLEDVNAIMNTIKENNIKNVIVVSGDTHSSYIDDGTNSLIPEISTSNLDVPNIYIAQKLEECGINIWNKGSYKKNGHVYGRITFKFEPEPYALLEIINEKKEVEVSYKLDKEK